MIFGAQHAMTLQAPLGWVMQALEKERAKWQKGAAERAKVREAARRARAGVEKARAKEKQSAERALMQYAARPCLLLSMDANPP